MASTESHPLWRTPRRWTLALEAAEGRAQKQVRPRTGSLPLFLLLASCVVRAPLEERVPAPGTFEEVVDLVEAELYDPARRDGAWRAASTRQRRHWEAAATPDERAQVLRSLLAGLGVSHTAFYTPGEPAWYELLDLFREGPTREAIRRLFHEGVVRYETLGLVLTERDGATFVADVLEGSPAAAAGVEPGDRLLAAAELELGSPQPSPERAGKTVRRLLLAAEDDLRGRVVDVAPLRIQPEEMYLAAQRASGRVFERGDRRIAYVHVRSWASKRYQDLLEEQLLESELASADALVLDLRGGWGGADPGYLALFDPRAPELVMTPRNEPATRTRRAWTKPVVLLVDGSTRSGKEVIAYAFKRHAIGPVVGERTAGAVLGGRPFVLRDGTLLMLAVADVTVDGERLEGVGVEPDVLVPRELPYSAGRDPQLEAALDQAALRALPHTAMGQPAHAFAEGTASGGQPNNRARLP